MQAQRVDQLPDDKPGDDCAVVDCDGRRYDYGALRRIVANLADELARHGVGAGDRIVIAAENSMLFVAAFLAVIRLEASSVPVNARLSAAEFDGIVSHCEPRCILFVTSFSNASQDHAERVGAAHAPSFDGIMMLMCPEVGAGQKGRTDEAPGGFAAMVYTSGTTGRPKGVMLSHRSLLFNARGAARMRNLGPGDQLLLALPCTHIMALSACLLPVLHAGASLRLLPRFTPERMLAGLAEGATIMPAVPAMYDQILAHLDRGAAELRTPRLKQIGSGGAPLDPTWKARIEQRFGMPLHNSYGMTEAGPGISSTMLGRARSDSSVGYVFPGCQVRLADKRADGVGELQIGGPNIMDGYFRDEPGTRAAITDDGYLRTGDLARIDADGAIHIVGRVKEMIIRSGFNIYPAEVEAVISSCPGVAQVAVVGRPVPGNEEVVAFVSGDDRATAEALRIWCDGRLTAYKKPQHFITVADFPMTAAGKVRKPELLKQYGDLLPAVG